MADKRLADSDADDAAGGGVSVRSDRDAATGLERGAEVDGGRGMMLSEEYAHAGDLGDLIYALPTIRARGGCKRLILHRIPGKVRLPWSEASVERVRRLLESQSYIGEVVYSPQEVPGHNLDGFRHHWHPGRSLIAMHAATYGIADPPDREPWLTVPVTRILGGVFAVLHRSPRYPGKMDWKAVVEFARGFGKLITVGTRDEARAMRNLAGSDIEYVETDSVYDLARLIARARIFVGNQSAPLSLAVGLGTPSVIEHCHNADNCRFRRPGLIYL